VSTTKSCLARWSRRLRGVSRRVSVLLVNQTAPGTAVTRATLRPHCPFQDTSFDSVAGELRAAWAHKASAIAAHGARILTTPARGGQAHSRCLRQPQQDRSRATSRAPDLRHSAPWIQTKSTQVGREALTWRMHSGATDHNSSMTKFTALAERLAQRPAGCWVAARCARQE